MIKIDITEDIIKIALAHAQERIKFEYDRFKLSQKSKINMIEIGCIGELIFKEYLKNNELEYEEEFQAGKFDEFDFKINDKIIDIKTSGYKVSPLIENLNMLYNVEQYKHGLKSKYKFAVQVFINGFDRKTYIFNPEECKEAYIAGYINFDSISKYPIYRYQYAPAYRVPLKDLKEIITILKEI